MTILGLGTAVDPRDEVSTTLAGTTSMDAREQGRMATPFAPFTLQPGEGIELFVDMHVKSSGFGANTAVGLNTIVLDYRAAWMRSQATLFLGMSINICKPSLLAGRSANAKGVSGRSCRRRSRPGRPGCRS